MTLTIGSLCTGYGGLDQAVTAVLDAELAWVADPDPGATRILAHHHPDVPNLGDITALAWPTVPQVDILTAGFPCQDISNAGKRAGIEGARSGIWTNVAHAVRVLRPRVVFLENVSAVVVRGLDRVVADLSAVGYDAAWTCLRASDIGAPHRRERWFCVAWPSDSEGPRLEGARLRRPAPEHRGGSTADPAGVSGGEPADEALPVADRRHSRKEPRSGGVRVVSDALGVGWIPWRPESAGQQGRSDVAVSGGQAPAHAAVVGHGHSGPSGVGGVPSAAVGGDFAWGAYAGAIRQWERALGRSAPVPTEPGRTGQPRLSPRFVEWLMGLPAGYVTAPEVGLTRNQQLHALGNGVVPQQGAYAFRLLLERATADVAA